VVRCPIAISQTVRRARQISQIIEVVFSPEAEKSLFGIIEYIAEDNPLAAISMAEKIVNAVNDLTEFPERGRSSNLAGRYELVVGPYLIIYRYDSSKTMVEVSEIWHQRQNRP